MVSTAPKPIPKAASSKGASQKISEKISGKASTGPSKLTAKTMAPTAKTSANSSAKSPALKDLLQNATRASRGLSALAHEMRLMAICHIGNGEKNVGELVEFLGTTQSNLSQHLAKLRDKDILIARKQGNQVFYSVRDKRMLDLITALQRLYCS